MRVLLFVVALTLLHLAPAVTGAPVASAQTPTAASQEASWLDGDLASWNTAGMAVPAAPDPGEAFDPKCAEHERPPETAADRAVADQGWSLFRSFESGWGVTLVWGLSGYDGMCRPWHYQAFVFVDDTFAGTIAPEPMESRTDGAADDADIWFSDQLAAEFRRYAPEDALCCPSGSTSVGYTIEQTADGPVLNPVPPS
jgi:hypothetical protein